MLICPKCQAQLEDGARFCDTCGAPIPAPASPAADTVYCAHCGHQVSAENPFCENCGKPLEEKMFCPNCGTQVTTSSAVCPNCSSAIYDALFCPQCGSPSHPDAAFCKSCGSSLINNTKTGEKKNEKKNNDAEKTTTEKKQKEYRQKNPKKGLILAGTGIIIAAALVCIFIFLRGNTGGSSRNYAMYVKDKELYYTDFSNKDPWQITSRLADDSSFDNYDLSSGAYILGNACRLSKDGSLLFFPDRINYSDDGYSLYYRNANRPKEEAVKIDSDVISYSVSDDASAITYLKNGTLYQYDRKKEDKQKIASDIQSYYVSDDGRTILYMNMEDILYRTVKGGEREKLDSDLSRLNYVSEDLSTVFYIKEDTLYKKENDEEKVKISSDVYDVIKAYDSGEIYYIKSETSEVPLSSYVYDDRKEADAAMQEPVSPGWTDPDYEAKYEAYRKEFEEFNEKLNRDYAREYLAEEKIEQTTYSLCYYNGEEESMISDTFTNFSYVCAADTPVITYMAYDRSEDITVKFSEMEDIYSISDMVAEALRSGAERYVAVGSVSAALDQDKTEHFCISADGKTLYYLDEIPEDKNYGELYQVSISSSGELGTPELYDSDVCTDNIYFIGENKLLYFKDYKNDKGELYINQEQVDYDVNAYSIRYNENTDSITYFIDWSSEKNYGTLKTYTKKDAQKIADDVYTYNVLPNGNVLYLYDYSQKYYHGDLYLWNKKDAEKLDDGVVCILPVS